MTSTTVSASVGASDMHKYQIRYTVGDSNRCHYFEGEFESEGEAIEKWELYCERFDDGVEFVDIREFAE